MEIKTKFDLGDTAYMCTTEAGIPAILSYTVVEVYVRRIALEDGDETVSVMYGLRRDGREDACYEEALYTEDERDAGYRMFVRQTALDLRREVEKKKALLAEAERIEESVCGR